MYGLANMTLFVVLINFLAALFGIQLIQGDMPGSTALNFGQLFNSFLAVYQILSGENWTGLLYDITDAELKVGQAITVCIFLCCWLLFSNCRSICSSSCMCRNRLTHRRLASHCHADVYCRHQREL